MAFRCARSLHRLQPLIPRHLHPQSFRCLSRPLLRHRCYSAVVADPSIPAAFIPIPKRQYQPPQPTPDFTPPSCCPGCGAPGQQLDANLPGYYPLKLVQRLRPVEVKKHKKGTPRELERERVAKKKAEEEAYYEALKRVEGNADMIKQLGLTSEDLPTSPDVPQIPKHLIKMDPPTPICNRCHDLKHHHKAVSLPSYPSLKTLTSLLLSSRHKHNHIYHLIDAADFPATLHPGLRNHLHLNLPNSITKNLTVSYIITRTDVLMPQRDQISSLMTYIKSTIKSVLPERETVEGGIHSNCRLYAVSNRTGWDIGKLKEEISKRQGGVWFFGAVNVGKSSLLSSIWPEDGRPRPVSFEDAAEFEILPEESEETIEGEDFKYGAFETVMPKAETEHESLDQILNKAQVKAKPNPDLYVHVPPTVSDVPGTTAAPIRVSYKSVGRGGKYKGEVVDLPGLTRWVGFKESGFMKYVRPEKRSDVIMKQRITPEQYTIKPGQSMTIGGLIMLTPKTCEMVLMNPFTNLPVHVASTSKCHRYLATHTPETELEDMLFQDATAVRTLPGSTIVQPDPPRPDIGDPEYSEVLVPLPPGYQSAGTFVVSDDVTTRRNPMLKNRSPEALAMLPYKVLSTDIVLEGIGWVEVTSQVRNRKDKGYQTVDVEVVSPEGKGIAQRKTMSAYMILEEGAREAGLRSTTARPRRSMKGQKKMEKLRSRAM